MKIVLVIIIIYLVEIPVDHQSHYPPSRQSPRHRSPQCSWHQNPQPPLHQTLRHSLPELPHGHHQRSRHPCSEDQYLIDREPPTCHYEQLCSWKQDLLKIYIYLYYYA